MAAISIQQLKQALRKEIQSRLAALPVAEKLRQSEYVKERVLSDPVYRESQRISIYLSMPDELGTESLLQSMLEAGKACFVPRYVGERMDMLRLYSMSDYLSLPKTKWNIRQPADDDESREEALTSGGLDLIIVPGLGFSKEGDRLGRGKGYYDSYQEKCVKINSKKPFTIALAFKEQIVDKIPTTDHDVRIDKVFYGDME